MENLTKKDIQLVGSAGTLEDLKKLMTERLYWSCVQLKLSDRFKSRLGKCYDVSNSKDVAEGFIVIEKKHRCSFYLINHDKRAKN